MSTDMDWAPPPLSPDDQQLIDAYVRVGTPLDQLAYTEQFEQLCSNLGVSADDRDGLHRVYRRLLTLRKQAKLPRLFEFAPDGARAAS